MEKVKELLHKTVKAEKPITLYSHPAGPNPWKVAILLSELNIPYETRIMDFSDLKKPAFESVNPNGRVPAIEDPNTGLKVWESGAIIEYILDTYDTAHTLSYTTSPQKWDAKCWLHFQTSGQGPYFGQKAWFTLFHSEKNITSAIERYGAEINRVLGVIEAHLKQSNRQYLIGDKVTYADLAFVPWNWLITMKPFINGEDFAQEWEEKFPLTWAWNKRLNERPAVAKCKEERAQAMAAGH